ncbi:non-ribosomal peptide synthetase [Allonocardiopsis opalescens]|uniref:Amino acid adenylation domain-containing protein/thioester reductase-like protein n=1 Tax=Allonocardiopsis opalescens TaxID=1144618 RepID=A0A2T0PYG3_9ACTN|nr:non-ribosomal peptide synthetase [Allonocardiopsis opalescens]PRX96570.1 amino acid adenylation domain-containing protein/thioester reductase-like protein [Allonocardiopsis opalescens]
MTWRLNDPELLRRLHARVPPAAGDGFEERAATELSPPEAGMWFLHQLDPDSPHGTIAGGLWLHGPVDEHRLAAAFQRLVEAHPSLCVAFPAVDGVPRAVHRPPPADSPFAVRDLSRAWDGTLGSVEGWAREAAARPFDLAAGPLVRLDAARGDDRNLFLVLAIHHIVADNVTVDLLCHGLMAGYAGRPGPGGGPRRVLVPGRERAAADLGWWRERLAGAPQVVELPSDAPARTRRRFRGRRIVRTVPAGAAAAVAAAARRHRTTPATVYRAAYRYLLHQLTGRHDLIIGCSVSTRRTDEPAAVGNFVNVLCLRVPLPPDPAFAELVRAEQQVLSTALDHRHTPFELVVEELVAVRDSSRPPLVQVVFTHNDSRMPDQVTVDGVLVRRFDVDLGSTKVDLTLLVEQGPGRVRLYLEYDRDLIRQETAESWLDAYLRLVGAAAADTTGLPMSRHPLTGTARAVPADIGRPEGRRGVVGRFEDAAAAHPDRIAVVAGERRFSYRELADWADAVAERVAAASADPDAPVAVLTDRDAGLVAAILGVAKAGRCYVPLDPEHPPERLRDIVRRAGVGLVVGQRHHLAALDLPGLAVADPGPGEPGAGRRPRPALDWAGPLYRIYTSGSTGRPKGVTVTRRNLGTLLDACGRLLGHGPDDTWTLFHSCAFDMSVWEMWAPLTSGGTVVVVDRSTARAPDRFLRLLHENRVTVLNQTPTAFASLVHLVGSLGAPVPPSLRLVVFAGEALPVSMLRPWLERVGDERPRLVNMYGITETTVHVTHRRIRAEDLDGSAGSPIGRALPHLSAQVLDPWLRPVPPGFPGELYVGGAGLADGYAGEPARTALRYIPDPDVPGARRYRSGDRVRLLPDGELRYDGRDDDQEQLHGYRIEPAEIEACLLRHPGVAAAGVTVRREDRGPRLIGFVVPADPGVTAAEVRGFVAERLPGHMVPVVVPVAEVPRTVNGKLDRAALARLPVPEPGGGAAVPVPPRTEAERAMAEVWQDVLGTRAIGVADNFFQLGGDSILAVQVAARLGQRGYPVSVANIFTSPTIEALAAAVPADRAPLQEGGAPSPSSAPFELVAPEVRAALPEGVVDAYPLTLLQQGMLYHQADDGTYQNATAIRVRAPFDAELLRRAIGGVVARHPVLRTGIDLAAHPEPLQLVWRDAAADVSVLDWRDEPHPQARLAEWLGRQRREPLDLARPPLIRFTVQREADDRFWLSATECHAVLDGWSFTSTYAEILRRYAALLDGRDPADPPPEIPFRDHVLAERRALADTAGEEALRAELRGARAVRFPALPDPSADPPPGRGVFLLPPELHRAVSDTAARLGVPVKTVLLTVHFLVLARLTGRRDQVTGLVVNGRPEAVSAEHTRGMYLNTLPLRLQLTGESFAGLARRCLAAEAALQRHRHYPGVAVERWFGPSGLLTTSFNYTRFHPLGDIDGSGRVRLDSTFEEESPTNYLLDVSFDDGARPGAEYLALLLHLSPEHFTAADSARIGRWYLDLLEGCTADPDAAPAAGTATGPAARPANAAVGPVPAAIAAAAAAHPDAAAVVDGSLRLSYRELAARAAAGAARLRKHGVAAETPVALLAERGAASVAAACAVWWAGGVYVPLDPSWPRARIEAVIRQVGAEIVVGDPAAAARLPGTVLPVEELVEPGPGPARPPSVPSPRHAAYAIFTSGSTGEPKPVVVEHGQLAESAAAWAEALDLRAAGSRHLHVNSLAFDVSIAELVRALTLGHTLVVARQETASDPRALAELLRDGRIEFADLPPSLLRLLLEQAERTGTRWEALTTVLVGGESWYGADYRRLAAVAPRARIVNSYGLTETAVEAAYSVGARPAGDGEPVPLAAAYPHTVLHLLDAWLQPVAEGEVGEVYVGGRGVARGYEGRAKGTALRFLPDPATGGRMYRTGDLARRLPDGGLLLCGRRDEQLNINGTRIEPGEVEAVLLRHGRVAEAAVTARDGRLTAFAVADGADPADLERFAAGRLPSHAVPTVVVVPALPLAASGKVDRAALAALPLPARPDEPVPARSRTERILLELWAQVLGAADIGVRTDFARAGGDSLASLRVVAKAAEAGIAIRPGDILRSRTVEALARLVDEGAERRTPAALLRADAVLDRPVRPVRAARTRPRRALLTGATGFVGSFLLRELIDRTGLEVVCLVRGADADAGRERLAANFRRLGIPADGFAERVRVLAGRLDRPRWGLGEADHTALAEDIDVVYHNGAAVDGFKPYPALRATNVEGTREVLGFAATGRVKAVHHVSTVSVFSPQEAADPRIGESRVPDDPENLPDGYAQSKWVAEALVRQAADAGVPASVYRLGLVGGHSETGACNPSDLLGRLLHAAVRLGCAPHHPFPLAIAPVDYVSAALVALSQSDDAAGETFHLVNREQVNWLEIAGWLADSEFGTRLEPVETWRDRIRRGVARGDAGIAPLAVLLYGVDLTVAIEEPDFDDRRTADKLAGSGIGPPRVDAGYLLRCVRYLTSLEEQHAVLRRG